MGLLAIIVIASVIIGLTGFGAISLLYCTLICITNLGN